MRKFEVSGGCTWCGTCLVICPAGAIFMGAGGAKIDPDSCLGCGQCMTNCASEAICEIHQTQNDTEKKGD